MNPKFFDLRGRKKAAHALENRRGFCLLRRSSLSGFFLQKEPDEKAEVRNEAKTKRERRRLDPVAARPKIRHGALPSCASFCPHFRAAPRAFPETRDRLSLLARLPRKV